MYKRILIATDGSKLSAKAVTAGIELAVELNAQVFAFMSVAHYPQAYYEGAVLLDPKESARIEQEWKDQAQTILDKAKKECHACDLDVTTIIGHRPVAESIISAAKKHKCNLIVMASHGHKGIKRLLLGSETLDVLTHSHIPVLVLR
jgi:nucleotide-binding universal stress UspA family protein